MSIFMAYIGNQVNIILMSCFCASLGLSWKTFKTLIFFCASSQSLVSKTIDAASAQFAASALVTHEQLMALKSKDEGVGVNGVVSASGTLLQYSWPRCTCCLIFLLCWTVLVCTGVYKGLHHTSSAVSSILPSVGSTSTSCPSPTIATTTNNGTSSANHHVGTAGPAPGQALMGGAVRVSVPSPAGTLSVRQLQRQLTVPTSALKLAANANRPLPKVTTGSTTLDMGPRWESDWSMFLL